jgi:hypothetical protein
LVIVTFVAAAIPFPLPSVMLSKSVHSSHICVWLSTLMSKHAGHCGITELFNIEKYSFMVMLLTMVQKQSQSSISEGSKVHVKVPSHHLFCESSATLQLFKQSTALLQTVECRKAWVKQTTGTEQGSTYCLV